MASAQEHQILQKSGVVLLDGEVLELGLESELWADSSNPIARLMGSINRILSLIVGKKKYGYILVTNKRIIEVSQEKACWVFNVCKEVKTVMPSSVKEVGYLSRGTFCGCLCQAYHIYYESATQKTAILLKGADEEEAARVCKVFYDVIFHA